jgi:hypothetical protein
MTTHTRIGLFDTLHIKFDGEFQLEVTDNGVLIKHGSGFSQLIACFFTDELDDKYNLNNYSAWVVKNSNGGQHEVSSLKKDKVFGFIYPINSLQDSSAMVDDKFKAIYARAAIESIIINGAANSLVNEELFNSYISEISITDLLLNSDEISIVVVNDKIMQNENISNDDVHLQLAAAGIKQATENFPYKDSNDPYKSSFRVKNISIELVDDSSIFCSLVSLASERQDPLSKFLGLYQIIEILINKVFNKQVQSISKDITYADSSWKLKDKLLEITSESKRISILYDDCKFPGRVTPEEFTICKAKSEDYIKAVIDSDFKTSDWANAIYKIRNSIVHNHALILKSKSEELEELDEICHLFKKCCISLVQQYGN